MASDGCDKCRVDAFSCVRMPSLQMQQGHFKSFPFQLQLKKKTERKQEKKTYFISDEILKH